MSCCGITLVLSWPGTRRIGAEIFMASWSKGRFSLCMSSDVPSCDSFDNDLSGAQDPASRKGDFSPDICLWWGKWRADVIWWKNTAMSWAVQMEHHQIKIIVLIEIALWDFGQSPITTRLWSPIAVTVTPSSCAVPMKKIKPTPSLLSLFSSFYSLCLTVKLVSLRLKIKRKHLHLSSVHWFWPVDKHLLLWFSKPWCPSPPRSLRV